MNGEARTRLLKAAPALAADVGYDELSIARLCEAAGVAVPLFKTVFGDLPHYVEALQTQFLDQMRRRLIRVTDGSAPGLLRIQLGSESYLAYNLETAALRRWLLAARGQPRILRAVQQQSQAYGLMLAAEFRVAGRTNSIQLARLYIAMLNEVASVELRTGRQPEFRDALWHFLQHAGVVRPHEHAVAA
jgi:AcrR family transcriptional regulator